MHSSSQTKQRMEQKAQLLVLHRHKSVFLAVLSSVRNTFHQFRSKSKKAHHQWYEINIAESAVSMKSKYLRAHQVKGSQSTTYKKSKNTARQTLSNSG